VIPAVAPRYGGPSVATFGMCHALDACDVETVVATTDADGDDRLHVETGSLQKHRGVSTIFFPRVFSESFKWSGPLASWLQANVSAFDLVHVHAVFSHSSIAAGRACHRAGVPYIVRPLGTLDPWSIGHHRLRKQVLMKLGTGDLLRRASILHYTSDAERALAEQALPWLPRGVVVPLGVDDECFVPASTFPSEAAPYVLALSRLHPKKGLELLVEAFHALADEPAMGPWSLVIAGDGDRSYASRLERLAASGAARERISFRGWVAGADRLRLVTSAQLFALPSQQENFGLAVAEAMAGGVPVMISPEVNLAADVEAHGAGWVVARNRDAWLDTLRTVLGDPHEIERRGRLARNLAEHFRWPAVGRELAMMYDAVVRHQAEPARPLTPPSPRRIASAAGRTER
jgi:glycosyltransferase involved in cell wall biosynthesis